MKLRATAIALAAISPLVSAAPVSGATAPAPQQQRPRFEATVNRVRVNVIVTDSEGRFIDDLRPEDFTVYEDGEPREVLELQLIDLAAGEITPLLATNISLEEDARADEPGRERELPIFDAGADDVAGELGAIVFFIDLTGLNNTIKQHFAGQWGRYLETKQSTGIPQAVYLVSQNGLLEEIVPLTTDMELLRAAQQIVAGAPRTLISFDGVRGTEILTEDHPTSDGGLRMNKFYEYERAHYSFRLLTQFSDALASRPGRTALVWVSRGVTLRGTFRDRGYEPNATLLRLQEELDQAANAANVSIYAVDPSRYIDLLGGDPGQPRAGSPGDELGNTLRHAAAATGGEHFIAWADFGEVVENIEQDNGRYYLLTYPGPDPGGDGEYHEIRVEVDRPEVSVRSKRGYVDYPAEERRSRFVSAALTLPGTVNNIPVSAQIFRGATNGDNTEVLIAAAIDGSGLAIQTDEDGNPIQRVEVHGVLLDVDENMEVAEEMHRQVTQEIDDSTLEPADWLVSQQELELEPGRYDLRIMAIDDATGRVGTTQLRFEIPEVDDDEWRLQSVMLLELDDKDESVAVVKGRVRAGRRVTATVAINGGDDPVVSAAVRSADQPDGNAVENTFFSQPLPRREGRHVGTLPLPALASGEYVLRLRVEDAAGGHAQDVEIPLRVVESSRSEDQGETTCPDDPAAWAGPVPCRAGKPPA